MPDQNVAARLAAIEQRLEKLERHLQLTSPAPQETVDALLVMRQHAATPPPLPVFTPDPAPVRQALPVTPLEYGMPQPLEMTAPPEPPVASKQKTGSGLEQTLGLKWAGWIGAIVLIIGVALGVRFGYDQGWLGAVPPWIWLTMIFTGGAALLGAGELVYRKIDRIPGASLMGAGVAAFFVASYAGHAYYKLYDPRMALLLTGMSTVVGAAVARRGNLVSIGVLSLIGGNLAPLLIHTAHPLLVPFLSYLLMLQVVALSLAYLGGANRWWTLRVLSLATIFMWMFAVLGSDHYAGQTTAQLIFALIYALAFQAELIATVVRQAKSPFSEPSTSADVKADPHVTFSLAVTAALTLALLAILRNQSDTVRTVAVMALSATCAAAALALTRARRNPDALAIWKLGVGFSIQSAALLTIAFPIALSGLWLAAGWAILALAFSVAAWTLDLKLARIAGMTIWFLAAIFLLRWLNPQTLTADSDPWIMIAGQKLSTWLGVCWAVAVLGQAVAWFISPRELQSANPEASSTKRIGHWLIVIAALGLWALASMIDLPPLGATLTLVLFAWALALADVVSQRLAWAVQAGVVLVVAAVKWAVVDALTERFSPHWSSLEHHPLANSLMAMALLLAVSMPLIYRLRRTSFRLALHGEEGSDRETGFMFGLACAVIAIMTLALTLQVDLIVERAVAGHVATVWPAEQLKQFFLTMLWSGAGLSIWIAALRADAKSHAHPDRAAAMRWIMVMIAVKSIAVDQALLRTWAIVGPLPVANVAMLSSAVAALALLIAFTIRRESGRWRFAPLAWAVALAMLTVIWAGTFEIERCVTGAIGRFPLVWQPDQLTHLLMTVFWTLGTIAFFLILPRLDPAPFKPRSLRSIAGGLLVLLACKFLVYDTLYFRFDEPPAPVMVLANLQCLAAMLLVAAMGLAWRIMRREGSGIGVEKALGLLSVVVLLVAGTVEIDRAFEHTLAALFNNPHRARQVAFSIFWSIFAVVCVVVGFRYRTASLRYMGLGLLAFTLLKVVLIDLGEVGAGYRILSFLGLGALMLGTSVLYGKLSPRLLADQP